MSTRPTNRIDAEYLLYLPFCHVFVSNDKLHRQLAPPLLGDYQNFVPLELFKKDLARFWQVRRGADAEHRRRMDRCFGGRPWPAPDSVLWALWEKYEPWKRSSGNRAIKLSDDELRSALVALHARCHVSLQLRWHGVPARRSFRSAFCASAGPSVLERTRAIALSVTAAERRSVVAVPGPRSMRGDLRGTVGGRGCSLRSGEPGDAMRRGVIGTITQWRGATALHCAAER